MAAVSQPTAALVAPHVPRPQVLGEQRAWYVARARHCEELTRINERVEELLSQLVALRGADAVPLLDEQASAVEAAEAEARAYLQRVEAQRRQFVQPDGNGGWRPAARVGVVGLENAGKSSFLSTWAAHLKEFLPVDDERCTGTACRIHHRIMNPGTPRFTAVVEFRSLPEYLALVRALCSTLGLQSDDVTSLSSQLSRRLLERLDTRDAAADGQPSTQAQLTAAQELRFICAHFDDIRQFVQGDDVTKSTVSADDASQFSRLIRPYIALTDKYPRAVRHVDLYAPLEGLDEGVELMDLPGIDSPFAQLNAATLAQLQELDLILFLHDARVPQLQGIAQLTLQNLIRQGKQVLFLATGIDRHDCMNPAIDQETKQARAFSPLRVLDNVVKMVPELPTENLHALSAFWYCDEQGTTMRQHPMCVQLAQRLSSAAFPADGMARLIQRIRNWCDTELAMRDADAMASVRNGESSVWRLVHEPDVPESRSVLARLDVGVSGPGVNETILQLLLGNQQGIDPDSLYAELLAALGKTWKDPLDERKYDQQQIDEIVAFLYERVVHFCEAKRVSRQLDLLIDKAHAGYPVSLGVLETQLRGQLYATLDSVVKSELDRRHQSMLGGCLRDMMERYKEATYQSGCINNLLLDTTRGTEKDRTELTAVLERALRESSSGEAQWLARIKTIIVLLNGVGMRDETRRHLVQQSIHVSGCEHTAKSSLAVMLGASNKYWQVERLFFLPWRIPELDKTRAKKPFTSDDFVVQKDTDWQYVLDDNYTYEEKRNGTAVSVHYSQRDEIVAAVANRILQASLHLLEMIRDALSREQLLREARRTAMNTLSLKLTNAVKEEITWNQIQTILLRPHLKDVLFPGTPQSKQEMERRKRTGHIVQNILQGHSRV